MNLDFEPVLLWTDALLFLLLGLGLLAARHAWGSEPLREAWRKVGKRPTGMAAATVLLAFVAVGVIDSLHYRPALPPLTAAEAGEAGGGAPASNDGPIYSSEVLSALDALLAPLRLNTEKTYSAPFAATLYQRETVELEGGGQRRDYPRLVHGAAHLTEPAAEQGADVAGRSGRAVLTTLTATALAAVLVAIGLARSGRISFAAAAGR